MLAASRGQVERLAYHALRGEVWDKALAYLTGRRGRRPWRGRPTARPWGICRPSDQCPLTSAGGARHTRAGSWILPAGPTLGAPASLVTSGVFLTGSTRGRGPWGLSPRRLASAGTGFELSVSPFLLHECVSPGYRLRPDRALALATATEISVLHALANQYLGFTYEDQRRLSPSDRLLQSDRGVLRRGGAPRSASVRSSRRSSCPR